MVNLARRRMLVTISEKSTSKFKKKKNLIFLFFVKIRLCHGTVQKLKYIYGSVIRYGLLMGQFEGTEKLLAISLEVLE